MAAQVSEMKLSLDLQQFKKDITKAMNEAAKAAGNIAIKLDPGDTAEKATAQTEKLKQTLQALGKEYQNLFKTGDSVEAFIKKDMAEYRKIVDKAYEEKELTYEQSKEAIDRIDDLEKRKLRDASTGFGDGLVKQLSDYAEATSNAGKAMGTALTGAFDKAGEALAQFCMTGKINFQQLANSIISDLMRITARQAMGGLAGWAGTAIGAIGGLFGGSVPTASSNMSSIPGMIMDMGSQAAQSGLYASNPFVLAKGGAFREGTGLAVYRNQIVTKPTLFPFAKGIGLMGEAGAEAIMPLTRMRGGDLGVKATFGMAGASAQPPQVNVIINTPPGVSSRTEQRDNQDGGMDLTIMMEMVDNYVAGGIASGRSKTANALRMQRGM